MNTVNTIPLKQLSYTFTTTSSLLPDHNKHYVFAFLISALPSTPLTIAS